MDKTKICKKCKRELPRDDTHFFKNKQLKDGFEGSCKECRGSSFFKRKEKPVIKEGEKYCSVCGSIYPNTLEYFTSDKQRKDGLSYYCKKCLNTANRKNYNSENKKYYYLKNREDILSKRKAYYINNKDEIFLRDKKYKQSDRGKAMIKTTRQKRRTLSKKMLSFLTIEQWNKKLDDFNNSCAYCGKANCNLSIDHFIPLSKGGELSISNTVPCCSNCNSSKNNSDFFEWYIKQTFYSKQREEFILKHLNYKDGIQQISIL